MTVAVSAYEELRNTPLAVCEKTWSEGRTVRDYPDPVEQTAPWEDERFAAHRAAHSGSGMCVLDRMERDFLIRTSEPVRQPYYCTTPDEAFQQWDAFHENRTIATRERTIADDMRSLGYQPRGLESFATMEDEAREINLAAHNTNGTPWTRMTPLTVRRIEWERRAKLSSNIARLSLRETQDGRLTVSVFGVTMTHEQRLDLAKKYVAKLTKYLGRVPTVADLREVHKQNMTTPTLAKRDPQAETKWSLRNYVEGDEDPYRDTFHTAETPTDRPDRWHSPVFGVGLGYDDELDTPDDELYVTDLMDPLSGLVD